MPYNYLLSPGMRASMGIDLEDAVIIIDEAHNIAQAAESVMEVELRQTQLDRIIAEI